MPYRRPETVFLSLHFRDGRPRMVRSVEQHPAKQTWL